MLTIVNKNEVLYIKSDNEGTIGVFDSGKLIQFTRMYKISNDVFFKLFPDYYEDFLKDIRVYTLEWNCGAVMFSKDISDIFQKHYQSQYLVKKIMGERMYLEELNLLDYEEKVG